MNKMALDKLNELKAAPMEENKENSTDGGIALESILKTTRVFIVHQVNLYRFFD